MICDYATISVSDRKNFGYKTIKLIYFYEHHIDIIIYNEKYDNEDFISLTVSIVGSSINF